jgi:hypothetical protein
MSETKEIAEALNTIADNLDEMRNMIEKKLNNIIVAVGGKVQEDEEREE